jgi:cation/acetate symporter
MLAGFGVTVYYMTAKSPAARAAMGLDGEPALWFGIQPVAAGVFGVAAGVAVMVAASLLWRAPRVSP